MNHSRKSSKIKIPPGYSFSNAILDILLDLGEATAAFGSPYQQIRKLHRKVLGIPQPPLWRFRRALKYLEKSGQIKTANRDGESFIKLTQKGKLHAFLTKLERNFQAKTSWDGKWRLIIWDIPESSRRHRDQLRYFCKNLGFYQLQKSVFITPYPLPSSAVQYLKESGLLIFIRFLRVDRIDDDRVLCKHFGLKIAPKHQLTHFSRS